MKAKSSKIESYTKFLKIEERAYLLFFIREVMDMLSFIYACFLKIL